MAGFSLGYWANCLTRLLAECVDTNPMSRFSTGHGKPPKEHSERNTNTVSREEPNRNSADTRNCLTLYLKEIGTVALLSVEEETELAARIQKGDKAAREQMIRAN